MSTPPPNNDNPSSRFSFENQPPNQPNVPPQNQQPYPAYGYREEPETFKDQVLEEVDDALGCSNRLIGCSLSLVTLPFRLVWRVIQAVTD
jgi:hypothetical protein